MHFKTKRNKYNVLFLETGSKLVEVFVVLLLRTSYLVSRSSKFGLINIKVIKSCSWNVRN